MAAVLPHDRVRVAVPGDSTADANAATGTVERVIFTGTAFNVCVRVSDELEIRAALTVEDVAKLGEHNLRRDARVALRWAPEDIVFVRDSDAAGHSALEAVPAGV